VEGKYLVEVFRVFPPALEPNARVEHEEIHTSKALLHLRLQIFPLI